MAKNNIRDWDTTASNNTDIAGIGIQGTNLPSNFDNALRTVMKQVADVDSGVEPVKDTWSFCDTVDTTKKFRFDGGALTTATTRVYTVPNATTTLAGLGVAQTFTEKQIVSGTSASETERMMDVRDARTTVGGIGNAVFSVARQNSNNPAVTIGNDGNNAGLIGADNATLRIGKWVSGVFTDAIQVLTTGVTNFLGNITGPSDFNISNGNGEEIVLENSTGRVLLRSNSTTLVRVDASGTVIVPNTTFEGTVTAGNGAVSGSASAPTVAFGTGIGWYRTATTLRATYNSTAVLDVTDTAFTVLSNATVTSLGTYNSTTATGANLVVQSTGLLQRSTSALKYKDDVQTVAGSMVDAFLSLSGVTYKSKCEGDDASKRHIGMIADYAAAAGLIELVTYNEEGEIEGFQYDRCVPLLLEAVKALRDRVSALEGN